MNHDFFAEYDFNQKDRLNEIEDIAQRIKILATALENNREVAKERHKSLVFTRESTEKLESLPREVKFPESLKEKIKYNDRKKCLSFWGPMSEEEKQELLRLSQNESYKKAINTLFEKSQKYYEEYIAEMRRLAESIGVLCKEIDLNPYLPNYSFLIELTFQLTRPYISKDDETFHICDNPIRKDKVFKIPMVSSTTWKGNLRFAGIKNLERNSTNLVADRLTLLRLFGHENKAEKEFLNKLMSDEIRKYEEEAKKYTKTGLLQGRLTFFPTYFEKIGLEVINPHDRTKRVGTFPIYFESVPKGAEGKFFLLYCPFNLTITTNDPINEVKKDIEILTEALKSMFSDFGFGAKKKASFGSAEISSRKVKFKKSKKEIFTGDFQSIEELKEVIYGWLK